MAFTLALSASWRLTYDKPRPCGRMEGTYKTLSFPGGHGWLMQRPFAGFAVVRTAQRLAVNGHLLQPQLFANFDHPVPEALRELLRIEQLEHPTERVVRGNAVGQLQERLEPVDLRLSKQFLDS